MTEQCWWNDITAFLGILLGPKPCLKTLLSVSSLTHSFSEWAVVSPIHSLSPSSPSPAHGAIQGPPGEKGERGYPGPKGKACHPFPLQPCDAQEEALWPQRSALLEVTPSHSEGGTFRISAKTLSWLGVPSCGLFLSVDHLCSRANLVFSFIQVTLGQWAHQDDTGKGDQKERRERKVGTPAIPRRAGFDCHKWHQPIPGNSWKTQPEFFCLDLLSFYMVFSTNPTFDFSGPQVNNCMLAEEKEELLVFKERGSSVLHRAAFPAAWVFTALMLKHPHCSADPLELIAQIWMSHVCVRHGPSVGVCFCYWCLALCPWALRLMSLGWQGLPVSPSPDFLYCSQIYKNLGFLTTS